MRIASLLLTLTGVMVLERTASAQAVLEDDAVYADEGAFEVGAIGTVSWAGDQFGVGAGPSVGWFVQDNVELSAIGDVTLAFSDDEAQFAGSAVFEPSYHLPFAANEDVFGFAGLGAGVGTDGDLVGFELVPRLGLNFPVNEGVLTPAARLPIFFTEEGTSVGIVLEAGASALF